MESLERQNLDFIHLQEGRGGLLPHAYKMSYKFCYIFSYLPTSSRRINPLYMVLCRQWLPFIFWAEVCDYLGPMTALNKLSEKFKVLAAQLTWT